MAPRLVYVGFLVMSLSGVSLALRASRETEPRSSTPTGEAKVGAPMPALAPRPRFAGVVVARHAMDVSAQVAGRLAEVFVRIGDELKAGAPIARVDSSSLESDLAQAVIGIQSGRVDEQEKQLVEEQRERKHQRYLAGQDVFTKNEIEATEVDALVARSQVAQAHIQTATRTERARGLRRAIANSHVLSPFDGMVSVRYADPGTYVQPGSLIVRIISTQDPLVRFALPPNEAHALREHARLNVVSANAPSVTFTVDRISPESDPSSGLVTVEARLADASNGVLHPGESVAVEFDEP